MEVKICDVTTCQTQLTIGEETKCIFMGLEYDLCPDCLQKMKDWVEEFLSNGRTPVNTYKITGIPEDSWGQPYWPNGTTIKPVEVTWPGNTVYIPPQTTWEGKNENGGVYKITTTVKPGDPWINGSAGGVTGIVGHVEKGPIEPATDVNFWAKNPGPGDL